MLPCLVVPILIHVSYADMQPIVGVLSLEPYSVQKYFPTQHYTAYISAAYVKFLESGSARVVPIWIGQDRSYYERAINYTNGILFPGGSTYFNESNGYAVAGKILYELAKERNDNGDFYPLMGICLGMQLLSFASAGGKDIREDCSCRKESLPLNFDPGYRSSKMLGEAPDEIIDILKTGNVTYNYHKYCLSDTAMEKYNLSSQWKVLSRNIDTKGKQFISLMEHKKYPFYGTQFHPEKTRFEFADVLKIPHNLWTTKVSQYFAEFFSSQCSRNEHTFQNEDTVLDSLIYNFNPIFTAKESSYFQLYMFKDTDFRKHQLQ